MLLQQNPEEQEPERRHVEEQTVALVVQPEATTLSSINQWTVLETWDSRLINAPVDELEKLLQVRAVLIKQTEYQHDREYLRELERNVQVEEAKKQHHSRVLEQFNVVSKTILSTGLLVAGTYLCKSHENIAGLLAITTSAFTVAPEFVKWYVKNILKGGKE